MELLLKVGGSQNPVHWRDGQIADIRPDGFHKGDLTRKHHCVLTLPGDYWKLRGSTDWKWPGQLVYDNIKKYLVAVDSQGKYPWEQTVKLEEKRLRRRDWFIDYKMLLDLGLITKGQFEAIYNKEKDPGIIYIERAFDQLIKNEYVDQRLPSKYSLVKGTVSEGVFSIGSGLNYDTVTAFEADIITPGEGPLTGDLTGEHNNEETSISSEVLFDVDTATYLLKLTAASGAEHNGNAYGNGARINYGTSDRININETTNGDTDDVEISKLAIDASGSGNRALYLYDGGDDGNITLNRILIKGDADTAGGVETGSNLHNIIITNNIIYGCSASIGLKFGSSHINTELVVNNTVIKCSTGIHQNQSSGGAIRTTKNNLCQGNTTDYVDDGDGWGTTGTNISEDNTSPDAAYQSKDVHTNSVFKDYDNDDYRLDSGGDVTNLAILDDGEDLSGTFRDDIQGQTRATWYIGASEIVAGGETHELSASITGATGTATPDLNILRALSGAIAAGSATPDTVILKLLKALTASIQAGTATPDDIALLIIKVFSASVQAGTVTPDNITLALLRALTASIQGASDTSAATVAVLRAVSAAIQAGTVTPDDVVLLIAGILEFSAAIGAATATGDTVVLDVLRELSAGIASESTAPDDVTLAIVRELSADIQAGSATPDDIALLIIKMLSASIQPATDTATVALGILREISAAIASGSSTSDAVLSVMRGLSATIAPETATSAITLITAGLGVIIDAVIESLTAKRTITSLTTDRDVESLTPERTIEKT